MKKFIFLFALLCLFACDKKIEDLPTKSDYQEEEQDGAGLKPPTIEVDTTAVIIDDVINIYP